MKQKAIEHMNSDHYDIVEALAKKFGALNNAVGAKVIDIDEGGMDIDISGKKVRVPFVSKANQNGEGYRHAIMEVCKDLEPSSEKLQKVTNALIEFIKSKNTVIISSMHKGSPFSSYAPFVIKDNDIIVLLSSTAPHYENIKLNPNKISLFFIQDEKEASTILARIRAHYEATAKINDDNGNELRSYVFDELKRLYPNDNALPYVENMIDFKAIRFVLGGGRFVRGFGAAYDAIGFKILSQVNSANPHQMSDKHGK